MEPKLLSKRKVPQYLVGSDYYTSLNEEEEFTVPGKFLKPDATVNSCAALCHVLETVRYWGTHKLPREVVQFLVAERENTGEVEMICAVLSQFDAEIPLLQAFQNVSLFPMNRGDVEALLNTIFVGDGRLNLLHIKYAAENGLDRLLAHVTADVVNLCDRPFTRVSMSTVVRRGHTGCLRFLLDNNCRKEYGICAVAAEVGRLDYLQLFQMSGCTFDEKVMCAAALHGKLQCLEYAHAQCGKITIQTAIAAAGGGYLDCLNYVIRRGVSFNADVLTAGAKHGHTALLPFLHERGGEITSDAVVAAASNGHLDCILYLIAQGATLTSRATKSAAMGGFVDCLELLRAHDCPRNADCVAAAATAGHLNCLEYLLQADSPFDSSAATGATFNGHAHCLAALILRSNKLLALSKCVDIAANRNKMECLQLLFNAGVPLDLQALHQSHRNPNNISYLMRLSEVGYEFSSCAAKAAIEFQNFDCLKYLCEEKKVRLTSELCNAAARLSDLRYIKFLRERNCPWSTYTCASAAGCNNLACLTHLREQGCPWDGVTFAAITSKHNTTLPRECLIYALENGCPLDAGSDVRQVVRFMQNASIPLSMAITTAAVKSNNIDTLKHILTSGAPMDTSTCALAARYCPALPLRSLVMLEYLYSQGCPWDERTINAAAAHPTAACLQFAHERGCPWSNTVALTAAFVGASQCLQYALAHGCPYDEAVVHAAAAQPSSECLQVLHLAGCRWSVSVAHTAASADSLSCLQYAHEHGCPWDITVGEAAKRHVECLHYCVQHGCPVLPSTMEEYNTILADD